MNAHILIELGLCFPIIGNIINNDNIIIVPILFPDSNHPLYPILVSLYVNDDVPVTKAKYISTIYMVSKINRAFFSLLIALPFSFPISFSLFLFAKKYI